VIHVTTYAIQRYQDRVSNLPDCEVCAALDSRAMRLAEDMGTCRVILPTGHRAVVKGGAVVTILMPRRRRHHAARIATNTTWEDETA